MYVRDLVLHNWRKAVSSMGVSRGLRGSHLHMCLSSEWGSPFKRYCDNSTIHSTVRCNFY
jgi:hypothetical protein